MTIVRNSATCHLCGVSVASNHRHDMKFCDCRNLAVDGGVDYLRRCVVKDKTTWTDTSIVTQEEALF